MRLEFGWSAAFKIAIAIAVVQVAMAVAGFILFAVLFSASMQGFGN